MEVGAVKQAFNNELILLKKKLNQAKTQSIHKLTRKAKTLAESKAPEPIKEKLTRKAESAVKEIMMLKTIKARDIGRFIVTHTGQLQDYLNKPQIDQERACARLLLHKALQDKYKLIRSRFTDVPIKDLFMSRQERRKLKKEARENKKNKKKGKSDKKAINAEGDWDVEDIAMGDTSKECNNDDREFSYDEKESNSESESESEKNSDFDESPKANDNTDNESVNEESDDDENETESAIGKFVKVSTVKEVNQSIINLKPLTTNGKEIEIQKKRNNEKEGKKQKDTKNKNFNEKILHRKFKKDSNEEPTHENKVVDPFFITSTGENYMSVAEQRQPDEIKEIHKQGNRKLRRAVMFGHVPKIKPRQDNFEAVNDRFNRSNGFGKRSNNGFEKQTNSNYNKNTESNFKDRSIERVSTFKNRSSVSRSNLDESKSEKLHPSWEAKKRQSGILPFQGKKIVFDES